MGKSEYEKMMAGEWFIPHDMELSERNVRAVRLYEEYNKTDVLADDERRRFLEELLGAIGQDVYITPPFYCTYGENIFLEDGVFINMNCMILDINPVHIGAKTLLGPCVQIYTVNHPLDAELRKTGVEKASPVRIGNNVWIGGGCIILPGVTIGDNSVIGAGSVVVRDIPPNSMAAGNPCRVIKSM